MENIKKIRILIISQYFPPDISGGGTRAFNYGQCLTGQNYDVTVITAHPHLHSKVPRQFRYRLVWKENMLGFRVIRVWIPSLLHSSAVNRIILHCSFIVSTFSAMFLVKPDIIFASEPNLFSIIPAYLFAKLRGGKIIRVVDDLWPEVIYERGYAKSKILRKILNKLARFSYSYPKSVIPLTEEAKEFIHKSYKIENDKILVVEHGINLDVFRHSTKRREEFFTLMYSGVLVESYDLDLIIKAADKLRDKKIKFIIRGKGELLSHLRIQKEKLNLENLIIDTTIVPLNRISEVLEKADVFLIPMKNEQTLNLSLPTKILEYQAIGLPIICCSDGAPARFIEKTKSGISLNYGDLDGLVEAILKLQNDESLCTYLGKNGRKFIEENLTFEIIGKKLSSIINDILSKKL